MLNPNQANPNHQFDQLPPQLSDPAAAEQLPLLQQPEVPAPAEQHAPLIRKEWTSRQRSLAVACGFAAVSSLFHMAEGQANVLLDELRGEAGNFAFVQVVEDPKILSDIVSHAHHEDNSSSHKTRNGHQSSDAGKLPESSRSEAMDWTDFAKDLNGENKPEPFKPNIPRTKLPFPITENTPAPEKRPAHK